MAFTFKGDPGDLTSSHNGEKIPCDWEFARDVKSCFSQRVDIYVFPCQTQLCPPGAMIREKRSAQTQPWVI
jgi:hypothetical protein